MFSTIQNKGGTLVELMIAMSLSVMISAGMLQCLLIYKKHQQTISGLDMIQTNTLTYHTMMAKKVHQAHSAGCLWLDHHAVMRFHDEKMAEVFKLQPNVPIQKLSFTELSQCSLFPKYLLSRIKKDSEILWVSNFTQSTPLSVDAYYTQTKVMLQKPINCKAKQVVAIHDCQHIDFIKIQQTPSLEGKASRQAIPLASQYPTLSKVYHTYNAQLSVLESAIYLVADTLRKNKKGQSIYALYMVDLNGRTIELIEGIEKTIFQFGLQTENGREYVSDYTKRQYSIKTLRSVVEFSSIEPTTAEESPIKKQQVFEWQIKHV